MYKYFEYIYIPLFIHYIERNNEKKYDLKTVDFIRDNMLKLFLLKHITLIFILPLIC